MANYKLNYSGENIDELLTKIDNLGTGTDTKSGTVKLSSATDSNSGVSDGVAATPSAVSQLKTDMDTKANKTDVLSLEEIQASTDLSGKIASASALKSLITIEDVVFTADNYGLYRKSTPYYVISNNQNYLILSANHIYCRIGHNASSTSLDWLKNTEPITINCLVIHI